MLAGRLRAESTGPGQYWEERMQKIKQGLQEKSLRDLHKRNQDILRTKRNFCFSQSDFKNKVPSDFLSSTRLKGSGSKHKISIICRDLLRPEISSVTF